MKRAGFRIDVEFTYLNNLSIGAPVLIAGGVKAGFVEDIFQKNLQTYVRLYLDEKLSGKLPKRKDTVISIFTNNLMGEKFINIIIPEPKPDDVFLADGDIWKGIDPPSIDKMMLTFSNWFKEGEASQVVSDIIQQTQTLRANTQLIFRENEEDIQFLINQGKKSMDGLSRKIDSFLKEIENLNHNYRDITSSNRTDIELIVQNMTEITRGLKSIEEIFSKGKGSLGKLTSRPDLQRNTTESIVHAKAFLKCIREKPWVLIYKESCD